MTRTPFNKPTMTRHLHIVLDEDTYQRVRKVAFDGQTSIGNIVRAALMAYLTGRRRRVHLPREGGEELR